MTDEKGNRLSEYPSPNPFSARTTQRLLNMRHPDPIKAPGRRNIL